MVFLSVGFSSGTGGCGLRIMAFFVLLLLLPEYLGRTSTVIVQIKPLLSRYLEIIKS